MIGVDWGISSVRAYRLQEHHVLERREEPKGILTVRDGRFDEALRALVSPWLADGEDHVLLSGMIGSRNGWREAGTISCPAGITAIAKSLTNVPFEGAQVFLVPGVADADAAGTPEFMRGEETQIIGADIGTGVACLPGSHSKWARVVRGKITEFATYVTGEAFAAFRDQTILARQMRGRAVGDDAFDAGVARSADAGGLLHHLFGVRSMGLANRLKDADAASYLSGIMIGHEVRDALRSADTVCVIGSATLSSRYARAITACGGASRMGDTDSAARGLAMIGDRVTWT
jgi:2-dehydro-3-deoxygalactonokinase